ncbi:GIDE domain-containing protein [Halopiger djelfimassiliensis]|uniref:GIDE domain-containing protein n=1 Tax=Halopiger djelfimassiliensis TaxID=1293047 RepID=UPI000A7FC15A|nr:GIDE domain-containing protein [Halopiger djelfimassiliensis]
MIAGYAMSKLVLPLFLVFVPAFLAFAAYLCYLGGRDLRKSRTIVTADPRSIGEVSARSGPIEVEGTAVPADEHGTVTGPFTETDCLAYTYSAQGKRGSGPDDAPRSDDGTYDVLDEGKASTRFYVEDETGRVLVDPAGATFEFTPETHYNAPLSDTPEPVEEYMQRNPETRPPDTLLHPVVSTILRNHNRFVERRLDIGDTVYITGYKRPATEGDSAEIVVGNGPNESEFVISDRSKRWTAGEYGIYGLGKAIAGVVLVIMMLLLLHENVQYIHQHSTF